MLIYVSARCTKSLVARNAYTCKCMPSDIILTDILAYLPYPHSFYLHQGASEKDIVHSGLAQTMETSANVSSRPSCLKNLKTRQIQCSFQIAL